MILIELILSVFFAPELLVRNLSTTVCMLHSLVIHVFLTLPLPVVYILSFSLFLPQTFLPKISWEYLVCERIHCNVLFFPESSFG